MRKQVGRASRWSVALVVTASLLACHRSPESSIKPEPADAFVADAGPTEADCLASCRAGVCSACPTVDVSTGDEGLREGAEILSIVGSRIAWNGLRHPLRHYDRCTGNTTEMACRPPPDDDCFTWRLQAEGLYYAIGTDIWTWSAGRARSMHVGFSGDTIAFTLDGRTYTTGPWEDRLSRPARSGFFFDEMTTPPAGRRSITDDALRQFIVDGNDVYYVDGSRIVREGRDRRPKILVDFKHEEARAPIAVSDDTLYVAKGADLVNWPWFHKGKVTTESVRDGVVKSLFTADAIYCFAATGHGAVVCRDQDLQYFPFDGGQPRRALGGPIVVPPKDADLTHATGVSLSADGGIAWFTKDDPKVIHVRTPPRSVLCGGPAVAKPEAGTVAR
ncbi:MAG: hypothetical protein ACHREM_25260 [Polyangiales bacterium]